MMELLFIFFNIIVPVFIIIGIGAWLHKLFTLNLYSLAKINIYFLIPGFVFTNLYKTKLSFELFGSVFLFFSLYILSLLIVIAIIGRVLSFNKEVRVVFSNGVLLFNAGNFGVPVNDLVFKQDPFAMSIQVIVMTLQNMFAYSYGIFTLKAVDEGRRQAFIGLFKMPVIYAMIAGIICNSIGFALPTFVLTSGTYVANAMVGIALLTLGAQVAQLSFKKNLFPAYVCIIVRLVVGPLIGYSLIQLCNFDGVLAQALFIASALPSAVNGAIIAQEYQNESELAAQMVLMSTFFSMVTVTVVIYVSSILF